MKTRLSLVVVLFVALLGSYVYAQFGDKPSVLSTIKIKDDLFVIYNDLVPGNTTVLVPASRTSRSYVPALSGVNAVDSLNALLANTTAPPCTATSTAGASGDR